jgi:hypothetical protein
MADTLEQIAERLGKGLFPIPMSTKDDLREWRDRHVAAILSALQSLARERDDLHAKLKSWQECAASVSETSPQGVALAVAEATNRAVEAEAALAPLRERVESLSQSLVAALERCQAAEARLSVQEPRQDGWCSTHTFGSNVDPCPGCVKESVQELRGQEGK